MNSVCRSRTSIRPIRKYIRGLPVCFMHDEPKTTSDPVRADDLIWTKTYDYVIVGTGTAGCVLANRLTEDGSTTAIALDAGERDFWWYWKMHMPAALMHNMNHRKYNWNYHTEAQQNMNDRVLRLPRGRVWGGSSGINDMGYIRGHAHDYDRWEKEGAKGWSYADCLPYFKKSQSHQLGEDDYRGGDGPLHVTRGRMKNPLFKTFMDAGSQAGFPRTADCNGYQQEGVGPLEFTIRNGKRWSASQAYLRPVFKRKNLTARTKSVVYQIITEGSRAVGVQYLHDGELKRARARKEVILSAGAINTPQLLMVSGIGDRKELTSLDIPVICNLPGVGKNLQDHLEVYVQYKCTQPITMYKRTRFWYMPIIGNQCLLGNQMFVKGIRGDTSTGIEAGGFIRTRDDISHPDVQLNFSPTSVCDHGRKYPNGHSYQVHAGMIRPTSRGSIKLKVRDPRVAPIIDPNYLATEDDIVGMRNSVKISREILNQKAFDEFKGDEIQPGNDLRTDDEIDAFVREHSNSASHPCGTCKMGDEDEDRMSVVDSQGLLHRFDNLRIVDASIMPSIVSGNLNGPVIMMAEKMADVILSKEKLSQLEVPVYSHLNNEM